MEGPRRSPAESNMVAVVAKHLTFSPNPTYHHDPSPVRRRIPTNERGFLDCLDARNVEFWDKG